MASNVPKTHYEILGVAPDAARYEIDDAYDELEKELFPWEEEDDDTVSESLFIIKRMMHPRRFMRLGEISRSYSILMDDERRRQYDAGLMVYSLPRYVTELQFLRAAKRIMMALTSVIILTFLWQALANQSITEYMFGRYLNYQPSWPALLVGIGLGLAVDPIVRAVMRQRWKELYDTDAVKHLKHQAHSLAVWMLVPLAVASLLFEQMLYSLF